MRIIYCIEGEVNGENLEGQKSGWSILGYLRMYFWKSRTRFHCFMKLREEILHECWDSRVFYFLEGIIVNDETITIGEYCGWVEIWYRDSDIF